MISATFQISLISGKTGSYLSTQRNSRVTRDEALDMFESLEEGNVITAAKMRKFLVTDKIH